MPVGFDLTRRIVNVKWGGGIFVAAYHWFGNNSGSKVWTNKPKSTKLDDWKVTFSTPANSVGFSVSEYPGSATYASIGANKETGKKGQPVFVIGGLSLSIENPGSGMMLTSSNGTDWSSQTYGGENAYVYLITWKEDEQALYAGMVDIVTEDTGPVLYDVTLKSTDGKSWNETSRVKQDRGAEFSRPPPVEAFCSDKIKDRNNNRVPTSVFGYDKNQDILIAPDPINMSFGITYREEDVHHGERLKIKRGPDNPDPGEKTVSLPSGMALVWAVAFAGGVWQAAGRAPGAFPQHGVIATSTDNGDTWQITLTEDPGSDFTSVMGGATADQSTASM